MCESITCSFCDYAENNECYANETLIYCISAEWCHFKVGKTCLYDGNCDSKLDYSKQ